MKKIKFNVARTSSDHLVAQGSIVVKNLASNPYFPDPSPSLVDFTAQFESFRDAFYKADGGSKMDREHYRVERMQFENVMRQMINYVNSVAAVSGSNASLVIHSSGFACNQYNRKIDFPSPIRSLKATMTGIRGQILVKSGGSKNARYYEFYMSDTSSGNFKWIKTQQSSKLLLTGLESGKRYFFKVRAVNRTGMTNFSNAVWMFAA